VPLRCYSPLLTPMSQSISRRAALPLSAQLPRNFNSFSTAAGSHSYPLLLAVASARCAAPFRRSIGPRQLPCAARSHSFAVLHAAASRSCPYESLSNSPANRAAAASRSCSHESLANRAAAASAVLPISNRRPIVGESANRTSPHDRRFCFARYFKFRS
jgi:hypothetical protein